MSLKEGNDMKRILVAIALAAVLMLAACSGSSSVAPTPTELTVPTATVQAAKVIVDEANFIAGAKHIAREQQDIKKDIAAEVEAMMHVSTVGDIVSFGPTFRMLQDRWLATGTEMDALRPEPSAYRTFYALWVQSYSQSAQGLDALAEAAETLNPALLEESTNHINRATALLDEAAAAMP